MPARHEHITGLLDQFTVNAGGEVIGVAAVSMDGLVLAAHMAGEINQDRLGAVAATLRGVSRRVGESLRIGETEEIIMKAQDGLFIVFPVGAQNLLAIQMRQNGNLGLVRLEARETAQALSRLL